MFKFNADVNNYYIEVEYSSKTNGVLTLNGVISANLLKMYSDSKNKIASKMIVDGKRNVEIPLNIANNQNKALVKAFFGKDYSQLKDEPASVLDHFNNFVMSDIIDIKLEEFRNELENKTPNGDDITGEDDSKTGE